MSHQTVHVGIVAGLLVCLAGCNLFNTLDGESAKGRGAAAHDPYGVDSGAVRLGLQHYKGCAIMANGNPVQKGGAPIPYPQNCATFNHPWVKTQNAPPMKLQTDTDYFLGKLTVMDDAVGLHTDFQNTGAAVRWFQEESLFSGLDWSGTAITRDRYLLAPDTGVYIREVLYDNAQWTTQDYSFLVEVLDSDGTPRAEQVYHRKDFLAETPISGHSRFAWQVEGVAPPLFQGDTELRTYPGYQPVYRTVARMDFGGSTNPFKTFKIARGLVGDGAIRVTWSLKPNDPLYFPVSFVSPEDVEPGCFDGPQGELRVPCNFGLDPQITFSPPQNGKYYVPGETFDANIELRDGRGLLLHRPDALPSVNEYMRDQANGLLFYNSGAVDVFFERDTYAGVKVAGPLQRLKPNYSPDNPDMYLELPATGPLSFMPQYFSDEILAGAADIRVPTRQVITLPENAPAGTYVAVVKSHRQWMGERFAKTKAFFFQVGTDTETKYPNRVGNCQICHRGVLSLDNLMHGLSVDHIESCKTCHGNQAGEPNAFTARIHELHMYSPKFPLLKNDCSVCHLTRESAMRPSIHACNSCHPSIHGGEFFRMEKVIDGSPDRFANCAQACHVNRPPTQHLYPSE